MQFHLNMKENVLYYDNQLGLLGLVAQYRSAIMNYGLI
jgi:hypothetical protein